MSAHEHHASPVAFEYELLGAGEALLQQLSAIDLLRRCLGAKIVVPEPERNRRATDHAFDEIGRDPHEPALAWFFVFRSLRNAGRGGYPSAKLGRAFGWGGFASRFA